MNLATTTTIFEAATSRAAILTAGGNPYHPAKHSSAPLDVLLCTIGLVILLVAVIVPAHMARAREDRQLAAEQPPGDGTTTSGQT